MNATIRGSKGLLALAALAGMGLVLRWVTAGSVASASAQDLTSMAFLTVGTVAWIAYGWLVLAILATVLEQAPGVIGRSATRIAAGVTSRGSRALLRSALGVAAVTPLTIGVAHANTTATATDPALGPRSNHQLSTDFSRPTTATTNAKPPSSSPNNSRTAAEHHSTISLTDKPAVTDWRAPERPSTIRLTETAPAPAPAPAQPTGPGSQPSVQAPTTRGSQRAPAGPGEVSEKPVVAPDQPRVGAAPARHADVPEKRVVVPDRPTVGAPTRYTVLRSGQLAQATSRVVKPGDSLWSIAAAELGPEATDAAVAARWPQWYAANRDAIGPNPSLIRPGQVLQPPKPGQPVPPTH